MTPRLAFVPLLLAALWAGAVGTVPESLVKDALEDGRDLPVTTDFRSVFAEVAGRHLGIPRSDDGVLFPGWQGERLRLLVR